MGYGALHHKQIIPDRNTRQCVRRTVESKEQEVFLITGRPNSYPSTSNTSVQPFIHWQQATGNPGRPIVSSNSHPTEHISEFVDFHIKPLVNKLPSYVKDTNHFLNIQLTLPDLPANSLLVTLDVSSLYTNIPRNEGIDACYHFLSTRNTPSIPAHALSVI